jgi:hypothetical protein
MPKKGERTWSDEQLRDGVASSKTLVELMRKLDLSPAGRNFYHIKAHIERLALDTSHFSLTRSISNYDDQLRELVPRSSTMRELLEKLALGEPDADRVRRRAHLLGLSTAHFTRPIKSSARPRRWTDDDLRAAISSSRGLAATLRALGLVPAGGNYDLLQRKIRELGIDTSHFTGKRWNKGLVFQPSQPRPLTEVLVADRWTATYHLKQRLIGAGLKFERCELCGWAERRPCDGIIPVELDHINGDRHDNRFENLRVVCPNCHALQPTHRGLNQKRRRR